MDKLLDYYSETDNRKNLYQIRRAGGSLIKHAAASEWPPEVIDFITKMTPKENMHYSLCNALGAGEYWSSNINGDFFEKDELINNHHTFLKGTPFMHHINKDPTKGCGEILFSAYNPRMNRVELVVGHDTTKLPPDIVRKLERDEPVHLSMGCRVTHDICSICGNKAFSPRDYCSHVTSLGLNYVFPDGRKVFVYNPNPDFFDISIVIVPADKTACVLAKIFGALKTASNTADPYRGFREIVTPSSVRAELEKAASYNEPEREIVDTIATRPYELIKKIAADTKTPERLTAAIVKCGAYLKPNEVQAVLFIQRGHNKIAKDLLSENAYFESRANVLAPLEWEKVANVPVLPPELLTLRAALSNNSGGDLTAIPIENLGNNVLGITPDMLDEIARVAMLSALIGKAMTSSGILTLPLIGIGSAAAAKALRASPPKESALLAQIARERDLYIEPLIRSKRACADLTLKQLYSIPFMRK